jgi:hypothetical protein
VPHLHARLSVGRQTLLRTLTRATVTATATEAEWALTVSGSLHRAARGCAPSHQHGR